VGAEGPEVAAQYATVRIPITSISFADDEFMSHDSYTHDLTRLVGIAGLKSKLDAVHASDKTFERYWNVVCDWSEEDRYNLSISSEDTLELYNAITSRRYGVMTWLKHHW
jgi:hypothetical protein